MSLGLRPIARSLRTIAQAARYGRPTGEVSTEEYVRQYPDRWRPVVKRELPKRVPPRQYGPEATGFEHLETIPELGLLTVPNGLVTGPHGWVYTSGGRLLSDCAWPYRSTGPKMLPKVFAKAKRMRGRCLNIVSDWSTTNYGHFTIDSLTRYRLFTMSGMAGDAIDYIYAPKPDSELTLRLMKQLGIPIEKCIWAQDEARIRADVIIAPSFPSSRYNHPRWMVDFLRTAKPATAKGGKRIYVPRGNSRNISNQAEILAILNDFDFEIYDCTKYAGFEYFGDAEIVVGAQGAGLTNVVYCKPGTTLLELIPSDHSYPFFYTLADSGDLDYNFIMGRSAQHRPFGSGVSPFDFWIDTDVFRMALEELIAKQGRRSARSDSNSNLLDKFEHHAGDLGLRSLRAAGDTPQQPTAADVGDPAGQC